MSSSSSLVAQWNAGYIILSYAIACLGSMVALELMKQRTAAKGLRNGLLLLGGAISLGAIGIWSMHFIGMMALTLHDRSTGMMYPHAFESWWTSFSFVLGIVIPAVGFIIAGDPNFPRMWKNILAGVAGGIGVSVMHYTGMFAMRGIQTEYSPGIVVASVLIGIFAATAAMLIFFRFGRLWSNDLRLQAVTSMVMGVAVCGMHYTGMAAASFHPPSESFDRTAYTSHDVLLAAILTLVGGTIMLLVGLRLYFRRVLQAELDKASCLTLQALLYDPVSGALLVNQHTNAPPSVIIQRLSVHGGAGIRGGNDSSSNNSSDGDNAGGLKQKMTSESTDFMRMFRASFEWGRLAFIETQLRDAQKERQAAGKKVDTAAVDLFHRFAEAAHSLSRELGIPVELFGKLHWQPANSLVTIVFAPVDASKQQQQEGHHSSTASLPSPNLTIASSFTSTSDAGGVAAAASPVLLSPGSPSFPANRALALQQICSPPSPNHAQVSAPTTPAPTSSPKNRQDSNKGIQAWPQPSPSPSTPSNATEAAAVVPATDVSLVVSEERTQQELERRLTRGLVNYRFQQVSSIRTQLTQYMRLEDDQTPEGWLAQLQEYHAKLVAPINASAAVTVSGAKNAATGNGGDAGDAVIAVTAPTATPASSAPGTPVGDSMPAAFPSTDVTALLPPAAFAPFDVELAKVLSQAAVQAGVSPAERDASMGHWMETVRAALVQFGGVGGGLPSKGKPMQLLHHSPSSRGSIGNVHVVGAAVAAEGSPKGCSTIPVHLSERVPTSTDHRRGSSPCFNQPTAAETQAQSHALKSRSSSPLPQIAAAAGGSPAPSMPSPVFFSHNSRIGTPISPAAVGFAAGGERVNGGRRSIPRHDSFYAIPGGLGPPALQMQAAPSSRLDTEVSTINADDAPANTTQRSTYTLADLQQLISSGGTIWTSLSLPEAVKAALPNILAAHLGSPAVAPAGVPVGAPRSQPKTRLAVGLFWSQASGGRGLQVLLPAAGPFGMVPHVVLESHAPLSPPSSSAKSNEVASSASLFGTEDLAQLLRDLHLLHRRGGDVLNVAGGGAMEEIGDSGQLDVVSHASSMQRGLMEMERSAFGSAVAGSPYTIQLPGAASTNDADGAACSPMVGGGGGHHTIDMSGLTLSKNPNINHNEIEERSTAVHSAAPYEQQHRNNNNNRLNGSGGARRGLQLQPFPRGAPSGAAASPTLQSLPVAPSSGPRAHAVRAAFFAACAQLSKQVGSSSDLNLWRLQPTLVQVAPGLQMALFMCCRMSPVIPEALRANNVFVPLPIYEVIHRSAVLRSLGRRVTKESETAALSATTGWARTLLADQLAMSPNHAHANTGGAGGTRMAYGEGGATSVIDMSSAVTADVLSPGVVARADNNNNIRLHAHHPTTTTRTATTAMTGDPAVRIHLGQPASPLSPSMLSAPAVTGRSRAYSVGGPSPRLSAEFEMVPPAAAPPLLTLPPSSRAAQGFSSRARAPSNSLRVQVALNNQQRATAASATTVAAADNAHTHHGGPVDAPSSPAAAPLSASFSPASSFASSSPPVDVPFPVPGPPASDDASPLLTELAVPV